MDRREFLARTIPAAVVPLVLSGLSVKAFGRSRFLDALGAAAIDTDHVLVLIQLSGGNDGLNTVIPLDQYSHLANARQNILLPQNKVLQLGSSNTGLHPSMTGFQNLFNEGKLCIVQGVSYPNPNFSHFRATDIWLTGSDSTQDLLTGWAGRYLDQEFPNFPTGYPSASVPDPLAIEIGSFVSPGLQGPNVSMGMALTSPTSFYQLINGTYDPAPNNPAGHELTFIRQISAQTQQYAAAIKNAAGKAKNQSTLYPKSPDNVLGDQLKIVAQLIAGGLKTRVYIVGMGGFDTHSNQVVAGATETGTHANLLSRLSLAIAAFQDDLQLLGVEERVIGMTFSEFGRRIKSNASGGTDHGSAEPMFIFGKHVQGGIVGSNAIIPSPISVNDNVAMQYDYRSVYTSILKNWFNISATELSTILLKQFQILPIISSSTGVREQESIPTQLTLYQNYPNPFNPTTRITFESDGNYIQLKVFDSLGREVATLVDGNYYVGHHEVIFNGNNLPSGVYYYRLQSGNFQQVKSMVLVK